MIAAHLADLARFHDCLELLQWLVEQIVLHHPQPQVVGSGRVKHSLGACQVVTHRLLQVDMPAVAEKLDHPVGVKWRWQQGFDRIDLEATRREFGGGREHLGVGPVPLALGAALFARVDERDYLDVGIAHVGAHIEVVNAPRPTNAARRDDRRE